MRDWFWKWRQARWERYQDWLLRVCACGAYGGVTFTNLTVSTDEAALVRTLTEALQLIERNDPRRFRRVQREVKYIAYDYLMEAGQWRHRTRACALSKRYCAIAADSPDREWAVAYIAAVIVHEATHGALMSRGCPYEEDNRVRVERLCHREQTRFVSRLKSDRYDLSALIPPFEETRWDEYWTMTREQDTKGRFAQYWADWRKRPPTE